MIKPHVFYSLILGVLIALAVGASVWVVVYLEPTQVNSLYSFYISIGSAVLLSSALILFLLKQRYGIKEMVNRNILTSIRQGLWVGIMSIAALILQSKDLFSWTNTLLLILALTFLEIYFLYNERQKQRN